MANKVYLAPTWETAQQLKEALEEQGIGYHTVEAEYGNNVLEGKTTLAHHVAKFKDNPAPCNTEVHKIPEGDVIIISHIDLDTIGGVLALQGRKPQNEAFWRTAEFIDLNGPHHINVEPHVQLKDKFNAYWGWVNTQPREQRPTDVVDVTAKIEEHAAILERVMANDPELIANGREWAENVAREVESKLVAENEFVRVFETDRVFCNSSYYSPNLEKIVPNIVTYNRHFGSITVSTANTQDLNAKELVQRLFGPEAGGHPGIGGSPRGQEMSKPTVAGYEEDLAMKDRPLDRERIVAVLQGTVEPKTDFERAVHAVAREMERKYSRNVELESELHHNVEADVDIERQR